MLSNEFLAQGKIIREPVGGGSGYWAGAPGACYDAPDGCWYLTYRLRRPRGVQPDRGGEVRIARSTDLEHWEDVLTIGKERYASASIERSCLHRGPDGRWNYFTSYVHPADGRWCTAVIRAASVPELDPAKREVIFTGPALGLEGVKDPWVMEENGTCHLILSVATPTPQTGAGSHATFDIFSTGECRSAAALATSTDLEHWEWHGIVLAPGEADWDRYCRRLTSIVPVTGPLAEAWRAGGAGPPPRYLGFYDGCAGHHENYEEKCALAVADGLRSWRSISPHRPAFTSPHASTSLRYLDAQLADGRWHLFYEFARADGAHDLRLAICEPAELAAAVNFDTGEKAR